VTIGMQGECLDVEGTALGTGTVGLIYVNPGGPEGGKDDPIASGEDITRVFGSGMSFTKQETVALVGGGHAFGKAHGACKSPPCGDGKGENTFTSGWNGAWTTNPSQWDNEFFKNLFAYEWELTEAPSGNKQWKPKSKDEPDIMMLTSDLALGMHKDYKNFSLAYANNQTLLDEDFATVWYKLVSADMGPSTRCIGDDIPRPQPFQNDLPAAPEVLPDYVPIRAAIEGMLDGDDESADAFINLAYRCASTYRATDYQGGCNGARIRLAPESEWPENAGTSDALAKLLPLKEKFSASYADLIVLAGKVALEQKNKRLKLPFCGGYVDADAAHNGKDLSPRHYHEPLITILDDWQVKGLSLEEGVALSFRHEVGAITGYLNKLVKAGENERVANRSRFSDAEIAMVQNDELKAIVKKFARNKKAFLKTFEAAWTKMMTADRFASNTENACAKVDTKTK